MMVSYSFEVLSRFLSGNSILELGPAEGVMTDRLVTLGTRLTVVEGAKVFYQGAVIRTSPSLMHCSRSFERTIASTTS